MKLKNGVNMRYTRLLLLLGMAGVLGGCGNQSAELSAAMEPIAQAAAKHQDRITPEMMADWIISRKQDYRLVDIRSAEEFEKGHIKDAENTPLASLLLPETLKSLPKERRIVVYSNGSEQAAKASVMLRLAGYNAYLLLGGYNHWQARILNPDIPDQAADDESPEDAMKRTVSCYFSTSGDQPVSKVKLEPKVFTPPVLQPGATGGGRPPAAEGC